MAGLTLQYYTDRVDAVLAGTVRGITGEHTRFITDSFGDEKQDDDNRVCVQLLAWQKPGQQSWQIDRYTRLGKGMGQAVKKERESKSELCFFDALEYCASFQMVQKEIGNIIFPAGKGSRNITSYRDAAKAAGQVIDMDGRLHPCAFGQILGDGFFNEDDLVVARATETRVSAPVAASSFSAATLLPPVPKANVPAVRSNLDIVTQAQEQEDLTHIFQRAIHTGTEMVDAIGSAMTSGFQYNLSVGQTVGLGIASIATAGIYPVKRFLEGSSSMAPVQRFNMAKRSFRKAVEVLPDESQKLVLQQFLKSADVVFQMEQAIKTRDNKKSAGELRKILELVDSACSIAGYNEADTQRTKQAILNGTIQSGHFYDPYARQWSPFLAKAVLHFKDGVKFSWAEMYQAAYDARHRYFFEEPLLKKRILQKLLIESVQYFCEGVSDEAGRIRKEKSLAAMLHSQIPVKQI